MSGGRRLKIASKSVIPASEDTSESQPIDVSELTGEPKPREWIVSGLDPQGRRLEPVRRWRHGEDACLAQQLLYAAGVGGKWLGHRRAGHARLGVFCEDDEDELHRRHNAIKTDLGTPSATRSPIPGFGRASAMTTCW
jgi:hypothetical protein